MTAEKLRRAAGSNIRGRCTNRYHVRIRIGIDTQGGGPFRPSHRIRIIVTHCFPARAEEIGFDGVLPHVVGVEANQQLIDFQRNNQRIGDRWIIAGGSIGLVEQADGVISQRQTRFRVDERIGSIRQHGC